MSVSTKGLIGDGVSGSWSCGLTGAGRAMDGCGRGGSAWGGVKPAARLMPALG